MTIVSRSRLSIAVTSLAAIAGFALGQNDKAAQPAGLPAQSLIAYERASLDKFVVDERDAGLKKALGMLTTRIGELVAESQGKLPEEASHLAIVALNAIAKSSRFAITYDQSSNSGGAFGYGAIASSVFDNIDDAKELSETVESLIEMSGKDLPKASENFKGLRETVIPGGKLCFGAREAKGTKGGTYDVMFGTVGANPDEVFASIPKPSIEGLQPIINGAFDLSPLMPLAGMAQMGISQAANQQGIKPPNIVSELSALGILGPDAVRGHFEVGYTPDALRFRVTVENAKKSLDATGIGTGRVSAKDLGAIPADAVNASMGLVSIDGLSAMFAKMRKQGLPVDEYLGKFRDETGVDIEKDLIPSLGGVGALYTSDSTGGGGFLSHVALLSIKDRAAFMGVHDKLVGTLKSLIRKNAREAAKYVRLRSWDIDGTQAFSLTSPGIPFPLEFSYAATDRFLIVGLTPQAVLGAVRQATGKGDKGILSRGDLRLVEAAKQELVKFSFSDTARLIRSGYGIVSLAGSAISNGVRSPSDKSREPGLVLPAYNDLLKGVKPAISIAYRSGTSYIMDAASDRSLLASLCGAAGAIGDYWPLAAVAAAGAVSNKEKLNDFQTLMPFTLPANSGAVVADFPAGMMKAFQVFAETVEGPMNNLSVSAVATRGLMAQGQ